jgi:hypothetical protein
LNRCDQIGQCFTNWASFGSSLWFFKYEEAQRNGNILGHFLPNKLITFLPQ